MIYFVRNSGDGSVKIGYSLNPAVRMAQLQTGCAHKLEMLGSIDGGVEVEQQIHAILAPFRMEGEWFRGADEVHNFIRLVISKDKPQQREFPSHIAVWHVKGTGIPHPGDRIPLSFYMLSDARRVQPDDYIEGAEALSGKKFEVFYLDSLRRIAETETFGMDCIGRRDDPYSDSTYEEVFLSADLPELAPDAANTIVWLATHLHRAEKELAQARRQSTELKQGWDIQAEYIDRLKERLEAQPETAPREQQNGTSTVN